MTLNCTYVCIVQDHTMYSSVLNYPVLSWRYIIITGTKYRCRSEFDVWYKHHRAWLTILYHELNYINVVLCSDAVTEAIAEFLKVSEFCLLYTCICLVSHETYYFIFNHSNYSISVYFNWYEIFSVLVWMLFFRPSLH